MDLMEKLPEFADDKASGSRNVSLEAKRDRRAQARHPVDTAAAILLIKIGSRLRGRIEDLSASGCRILCDERFPVGIYTRVETEFCLEGLPFRLGGVIQAIHDRRTVGIRFLDMSGRKREQIEQLIVEIEQVGAKPLAAQEGTIEELG
jgi:c-di-GMP-binding flagellar brake protein YcgR